MRRYADEIVPWIHELRRRAGDATTVVLGVHGPQGSGKSTLCRWLVDELGREEISALSVSIDDCYLTHAEQRALAAAHSGNRYLEHRGYPGTHDVSLGARLLDALVSRDGGRVAVPGYDKGAHGGRGDRRPRTEWREVTTPLDVVLFEGWMLGFSPLVAERVSEPALREPNRRLAEYRAWQDRLHGLIWLDLEGERLEPIVQWRIDSERARKAAGADGLSDADARDYIERFLPAYRMWSPRDLAARIPSLRIGIGREREHLFAEPYSNRIALDSTQR